MAAPLYALIAIQGILNGNVRCDSLKHRYRDTCCPHAPHPGSFAGTDRLCSDSILSLSCGVASSTHCDCRGGANQTAFCSSTEDALLDREWDVVIVGSGPGGFGAALAAHDRGLSTLVLERGPKPSELEANQLKDTRYMEIGGHAAAELNKNGAPPLGWININDTVLNGKVNTNFDVHGNAIGGGLTVNGLIYNIDEPSFSKNADLLGTARDLIARLGMPVDAAVSAGAKVLFERYRLANGAGLREANYTAFIPEAATSVADRRLSVEDLWPSDVSVLAGRPVDKVLFNGTAATGVQLVGGRQVRAKNVVLSAGVWSTSAILQRSGVGPRDLLESLGVTPVADTSVGENVRNELCLTFLVYIDNLKMQSTTAKAFANFLSDDERVMHQMVAYSLSNLLPIPVEDSGTAAIPLLCGVNSPFHQRGGSDGRVRIRSVDPQAIPQIDFGQPMDNTTAAAVATEFNRVILPFLQSFPSLAERNRTADHGLLKAIFGDTMTPVAPGVEISLLSFSGLPKKLSIDLEAGMTAEEAVALFATDGSLVYHSIGGTQHLLSQSERGRFEGLDNLYVADASAVQDFPWSASSLFMAHGYRTVYELGGAS